MTIEQNEIWAGAITVARPAQAKIAAGFQCGDADPDLFNWLFQYYSQCLYDMGLEHLADTEALTEFINSQDIVNTTFDNRTQLATSATAGISRLAQVLDLIGNSANGVLTTETLNQFSNRFGSFWRKYNNNNDQWDIILQGGNDFIHSYQPSTRQELKGVYSVSVTNGSQQFGVNFEVFWKRRLNNPDFFYDEKTIRFIGNDFATLRVQADIAEDATPRIVFTLVENEQNVNLVYHITAIEKLKMPSALVDEFNVTY